MRYDENPETLPKQDRPSWHTRFVPTVLHRGHIYSPAGAELTAMVVADGLIVWLGTDDAVAAHIAPGDTVVDLRGALVAPAFVDAHVHTTATGLALDGLDLAGTGSAEQILDRLASYAARSGAAVLLGSGWDDSGWVDRRLPTPGELSRAGGGRPVYLARVDAHSALVSGDLLDHDGHGRPLDGLAGYDPSGWLRRDAHDAARVRAHARLSAADRRAAQHTALRRAAALGIGCVHEMAGPSISGADDLAMLLAGEPDGPARPEVVGYWGELDGIDTALALGATGAAGDLFCDGAIGSHTAALSRPYTDRPQHRPAPRFTAEQIGAHVIACTRAGLQAGFHAIGDAAVDVVLDGMDLAVTALGPGAVRGAGHRVEHAEMVTDPARMAAGGLIASVQPAFDAAWGGPDGMYAERLGGRAAGLNDFAALSSAGVALALGSDSPVTALDPWGTVRAAAYHRTAASSISVRAAFTAHTRGGWRAARRDQDGSGVLAVGHPATYAVWDDVDLVIDAADERVSRWSTDPRSGVAALPDVTAGLAAPRCRRTVVRGRTVHDAESGLTAGSEL